MNKTVPVVKANLTGPQPRRFRHRPGAVFGSETKKEKINDSPGPGNYEPRMDKVRPRVPEVVMDGSQERHSYINKNAAT